jgi:hypothetical protein
MAKSNRLRAKNKIEGSHDGSLIKVDPDPFAEAPQTVRLAASVTIPRSTLFTAEFEEIIELIARERVYRAMLAGLGRRLLMPPMIDGDDPAGRW